MHSEAGQASAQRGLNANQLGGVERVRSVTTPLLTSALSTARASIQLHNCARKRQLRQLRAQLLPQLFSLMTAAASLLRLSATITVINSNSVK